MYLAFLCTNRAIEANSRKRIASDGMTIAFAGLAIGESVIAGLTFAAATSVSQSCARTLTGYGIAKV